MNDNTPPNIPQTNVYNMTHQNTPEQSNMTSQIPTDLIHEFEFQLVSMPHVWLKADVTASQSLQAIKSGLLHNQPLSKIRLFTISDDDTTIYFIYDVVSAKQGINPWSTQTD